MKNLITVLQPLACCLRPRQTIDIAGLWIGQCWLPAFIVLFHDEIRPCTNTGAHGFLTNYIDYASRRGGVGTGGGGRG